VKTSVLPAEPLDVRTLMCPLAAPGGTVKVTLVALTLVGTAIVVPSMTPTVPAKLVPVIVTGVPTGPLPGEIPLIDGGGSTVTLPALVSLPPGAATWTVPPAEPVGTVKVSLTFEATLNGTLTPPSCT
jgi:hypothetical protein